MLHLKKYGAISINGPWTFNRLEEFGSSPCTQKMLEVQFNAINALNYKPTFTESFESAQAFLNKL